MPTFLLGKTCAVYLAGYAFSGNLNGYDSAFKVKPVDNTVFSTAFHRTQQAGLLEADIALKGFYTHTIPPDVTGYRNQLDAAVRSDAVGLQINPGAGTVPAAGDLADLWVTTAIDHKLNVTPDKIITLDATLHAKDGLHLGVVLAGETAYSGAPFLSTAYDQGGGGWVLATYRYRVIAHVTAYTSGLAALKVQTSPDNSTWTTRGTFPAITGIGGFALDLNAPLDRYLRINDTGVATIISAFAIMY